MQPCKGKLACGHVCSGTCDSCMPSTHSADPSHIPCTARCEARLCCNHKCHGTHACGDVSGCPPCEKRCSSVCGHFKCAKLCSETCTPCKSPCSYQCPHMSCTAPCSESHRLVRDPNAVFDIAVYTGYRGDKFCDEPCDKSIQLCGHACMGVCGEVCPNVCAACGSRKLNAILKRSDISGRDRKQERYKLIQLGCGHIFETNYINKHVGQWTHEGANMFNLPNCPECQATIFGVHRYSSVVSEYRHRQEPDALRRHQELLYKEVNEDIVAGRAGVASERLQAILAEQKASGRYDQLSPLVYLLLGLTCAVLNKMSESRDMFCKARDASLVRPDAITRAAYVCLALYELRGSDDSTSIQKCPLPSLRLALENLVNASKIPDSALDTLRLDGMFHRSPGQVRASITLVEGEIERKVAKQEKDEARRLQLMEAQRALAIKKANDTSTAVTADPGSVSAVTHPPVVIADGSSALHVAVGRGQLEEVKLLLKSGGNTAKLDSRGNTALLVAAENGHCDVVAELLMGSPWHVANSAKSAFLDLVLGADSPVSPLLAPIIETVEAEARKALLEITSSPSRSWSAMKFYNKCSCLAIDKLMDMTGIGSVKAAALELYQAVQADMSRPEKARICSSQAMNFAFTGNPGKLLVYYLILNE